MPQKDGFSFFDVLEAFPADFVETIPTKVTPKPSELQFIFWSEVDPTTLDLSFSLRESGSYFENAEGVRFLGVQLQTALESRHDYWVIFVQISLTEQ